MNVSNDHFLIFSFILFCIGLTGVLIRKNLVYILMSIELILASVQINFAFANRFLYPDQQLGYMWIIFILTIAAAEVAIAIAL
ncbi:MAG: NADH-quinone oxidoreductase subunit NuoK, partial [Sediminibacterium sp.]|nr:NADH-quinone oxidoreductase subunit NuoK [Sediminibacterium sp.]